MRLARTLTLLVCAIPLSFAQSDRGTISGAVSDKSGAVIPAAKITITNTNTGSAFTQETNESGSFLAPNLVVGPYSVRVDKQGFRPALLTGVTVNASSNIRADVTLDVASTETAVEVQATAITLQTEDAKTSSTVTNKMVDQLPLVVSGAIRSPFDLATLTPEAKNIGGNAGYVLGGGQGAAYGTTLDGVSVNTTRALEMSWVVVNAPSLEAITEFTVDTNGFKAEYGHASGGVMTFVSKSGTNDFHGSAYEFLRNQKLDANNFFNNALGQSKPIYKQNDFGGSIGGPVWIPGLYRGRNKTFFFVSFEAFRNREGARSAGATVPTEEMYNGDFSKWVNAAGVMLPLYNPLSQTTNASGAVTRTVFPGNQVPRNLWDPVSVRALAAFQESGVLKPNRGGTPGTLAYVNNNYLISQGSEVRPQTKWSFKGDHLFSDKQRISAYYGYNRSFVTPSSLGPATLPDAYSTYNDTTRHSDVFRLSWDWTVSPNKFNHFYAGGNNWRENHEPLTSTVFSGRTWKDKVCLGNVPNCDENIINLAFSGYTSWGGPANNGSENTIFSFNNDFTWIKGKHNMKFGGQHQRGHYNGFGRQCIAGCANFQFTGTNQANDTNSANGGNGFASFLLGWANQGSIDTVRFISQQWPYFAGYIQDDWKATPKLTLNIGLRWETTLPPVEANDKWSDFDPVRPNPRSNNIPGALIYAGTGPGREGTRSLADVYHKAWGPRFGFAYSPNQKMVIRGSYSRSFAAITTVTGSTHQRGFTQTFSISSSNNGVNPAFRLNEGFPTYPVPPFIDPSFANRDNIPWWQGEEATRPPEMNSFNLSIQRQLGSDSVFEMAYNGVLGTHLQAGLLAYNQISPQHWETLGRGLLSQRVDSPAAVAAGIKIPYANFINEWGSNATVARALRPFPQYGNIDTAAGGGDHSGHSTYHSGMLRYEKRFSTMTIQTSYVFSKVLTDADSYWPDASASDHFNRGLEKSIGEYDVTHNFKFSGIYDLPFGKGRKYLTGGPASWIFGGWRISGIALYSSGQPLGIGTSVGNPIFAGRNVAHVPTYDGWRGAQAGDSFDPFKDRFFQPASFFGAQPDRIGNVTRHNPKLRQFANLNENISLAKSFPITEGLRLDFRFETFNSFNRTRFGTGSNTIQSQTFGQLLTSSDLLNTPRQVQFGLKLVF